MPNCYKNYTAISVEMQCASVGPTMFVFSQQFKSDFDTLGQHCMTDICNVAAERRLSNIDDDWNVLLMLIAIL